MLGVRGPVEWPGGSSFPCCPRWHDTHMGCPWKLSRERGPAVSQFAPPGHRSCHVMKSLRVPGACPIPWAAPGVRPQEDWRPYRGQAGLQPPVLTPHALLHLNAQLCTTPILQEEWMGMKDPTGAGWHGPAVKHTCFRALRMSLLLHVGFLFPICEGEKLF